MRTTEQKYELDTKISGKSYSEYVASLLEKNERLELDKQNAKISIGLLKSLDSHSAKIIAAYKTELDTAKFEYQKERSSKSKRK